MNLPLNSFKPLRFAEDIDSTHFEELCRDVWEKQPTIQRAENYGVSGSTQKGVDILGRRLDGSLSLGSCKNERKFTEVKLRKAVDQFWPYLEEWKKKSAVEFVVFVGSSKQNTALQDAITAYTTKFLAEGLSFSVWDNRDITDEIRKHRDVGTKHFEAHVQTSLYGSSGAVETPAFPQTAGIHEAFALEFGADVDKLLPNIRQKARSGRWNAALEDAQGLVSSPRWPYLDAHSRSKVLFLTACLHLDTNDDVTSARRNLELAKSADPAGKFQVVEGVIALREGGSDAALALLEIPESVEAWNIKLSVMTQAGAAREVVEAVTNPLFEPTSGTFRAGSIAAMIEGELIQARTWSLASLESSPEDFYNRVQWGTICYLSSVLPGFSEAKFLAWPIPPDWEFIKTDQESLDNLFDAEKTFSNLISIAEPESIDVPGLEAWKLGSLANHPDRQAEAEAYARELLTADPAHIPALIWSLERGFPFDKSLSEAALRTLLADESVAEVHALCTLLISDNRFDEASKLLDEFKQRYFGQDAASVWNHLKIQLAIILDENEAVKEIIDSEAVPEWKEKLQFVAQRALALKTKSPAGIMEAALAAYESTGHPNYLFEACEAALAAGDPESAAVRSAELLTRLPSTASLTIAAHSNLEAGHYGRALAQLEAHADLIPRGSPGRGLSRIKIECIRQRGDIPQALRLAEQLAGDSHLLSQLTIFNAQMQGADFSSGVKTARILIEDPNISGGHLLHIAKEIQHSDRTIATTAFTKAIEKGIADQHLPHAIPVAFQLGLDEEATPLLKRLASAPENSGAMFKTDAELSQHFRHYYLRADNFSRAYQRGEVPIHFGGSILTPNLFEIFLPGSPASSPGGLLNRDLPALIKGGIRRSKERQIGVGELFMDFSAFLVAHQTGILSEVESSFAPILVSPHTLELLRTITDAVAVQQASRIDTARTLQALIEEGVIQLSSSGADIGNDISNESNRKWTCRTIDPHVTQSSEASGAASEFLITPQQLIAYGVELDQSSSAESDVPQTSSKALPPVGAEIHLDEGSLGMLASAENVKNLAKHFSLLTAPDVLTTLRLIVEEGTQAHHRVTVLTGLAERIQRGSSNGIYKFVTRDEKPELPSGNSAGPAEMALFDMGIASSQGAKFVWCDDRFVNNSPRYEESVTVGVCDILLTLRDRQKISKSEHLNKISILRKFGFRYLAPTPEEIAWNISKSTISEDGFTESGELTVLRQYLAVCFLETQHLRRPDPVSHQPMEFRFLLDCAKAISKGLAEVWREEQRNDEEKRTVSDYLLGQLFVPLITAFEMIGARASTEERIDGLSAAIAILFTDGFDLPLADSFDPNSRQHTRAKYYDWIAERLINRTELIDSSLAKNLAQLEIKTLFTVSDRHVEEGKAERTVINSILLRMLFDLPEVLRRNIDLTAQERRKIGVKRGVPEATVDGIVVRSRDIWRACAKVARKRKPIKVRGLNSDEFITIESKRNASKCTRIVVRRSTDGRRSYLSNSALWAATNHSSILLDRLVQRADWLDTFRQKRYTIARSISKVRDPASRIEMLLESRENSLGYFYSHLDRRLRSRQSVEADSLIPGSSVAFFNHLRLTGAEMKNGNLNVSEWATVLIRELGLARSAAILVQLPIPLPASLLKAFLIATPREKNFVIARLQRLVRHPLGLIQIAQLCGHCAHLQPLLLDQTTILVEKAFSSKEGQKAWVFYECVLKWSFSVFSSVERLKVADARWKLLLAWVHAGNIFNSFAATGSLLQENIDVFEINSSAFGLDLGGYEPEVWDDCMHIRFSQRMPVLLAALGSVIRALPGELASQLRRAEFVDHQKGEKHEDNSMAFLLRDNHLMRNSFGSFLRDSGVGGYRSALSEALAEELAPPAPDALRATVFENLSANPKNADEWKYLSLCIADLPLPDEEEAKLKNLLMNPEFGEFVLANRSKSSTAMRLATSRLRFASEDRDLKAKLNELVASSFSDRSNGLDAKTTTMTASNTITYYMNLAVVIGDEDATYRNFFSMLAELVKERPETAALFMHPVWCWPNRWPFRRQSGFWTFELIRRSV